LIFDEEGVPDVIEEEPDNDEINESTREIVEMDKSLETKIIIKPAFSCKINKKKAIGLGKPKPFCASNAPGH
jgi:hypothetical protein